MAPAKRKATSSPARSSARLSQKMKMITTNSDTEEGLSVSPLHPNQMSPASPVPARSSARLSQKMKMTTTKPATKEGLSISPLHRNQMPPAKRKATSSPAPARSSARLSQKMKMITTNSDTEEGLSVAPLHPNQMSPASPVPARSSARLSQKMKMTTTKPATKEGLSISPLHRNQMPPAKRKATSSPAPARSSARVSKKSKRTTTKFDTEEGLYIPPLHPNQMPPAKRKATSTRARGRSSARLSSKNTKKTTTKPDTEEGLSSISPLHPNQMAPAKRKEASTPAPAPATSSARLSKKMKMKLSPPLLQKIPDRQEEMKQESPRRAPRVQLPHACKERLDELTRALDFNTLGSTVDFLLPTTEGAKFIAELTRDMGFDNGRQTIDWLLEMVRTKQSPDFQNARRQLDWLLPIQTGRLEQLTRELGFDRGGQTVDWILPMASNDFLKLTHLLGFQDSTNTIEWLLHQAKPAIAARIGRHSASTGTAGYSYSSPSAPPFISPEVNVFVNIEIEPETEKQRDVISEVKGHKDGRRNQGLLEEEKATNIVEVDAVDIKDIEPRELSEKPMNEFVDTEIETQRKKKQEVNEFVNIEIEPQTEKQRDVISAVEGHKDGGNQVLLEEAEATGVQIGDTNIVEVNAVDIKNIVPTELTEKPINVYVDTEIETQTKKKQEVNEFVNIEIEPQTEKQRDVISAVEGHKDGGNQVLLEEAEATGVQIGDTNIVEVNAVDIKNIVPTELTEKPINVYVDTEIETQTKKKQEVNEFVNIEIEPQTEKQRDVISAVEGHKDGGNQVLLEEAEATGVQIGDTNIVEVNAVDIKNIVPTELTEKPINVYVDTEIETQTKKKQEVNEFVNIEIEPQTEKQRDVISAVEGHKDGGNQVLLEEAEATGVQIGDTNIVEVNAVDIKNIVPTELTEKPINVYVDTEIETQTKKKQEVNEFVNIEIEPQTEKQRDVISAVEGHKDGGNQVLLEEAEATGVQIGDTNIVEVNAVDIKNIVPTELTEKPINVYVDTEIETQTKKKQEVNEFVNIEIEPQTEKQRDVISAVEGHKDGGNQVLLEEAEATGVQIGDTNIVEVNAVDIKNIVPTELTEKPINVYVDTEIETQTKKKQEVNEFVNIEIEPQTEKQRDVISAVEGHKDGGNQVLLEEAEATGVQIGDTNIVEVNAVDIKNIVPTELTEKPINVYVDTEIETQTKKKQEVNEFVNIEIEPQTEKQRDFISEMEGYKDGGGNHGLLEEAEATGLQDGDTNIVEVDAVDIKDKEPRELSEKPMNEFVDTEIETQTKKKQEVNIEIESETEKQRDVISEVEGHKDGGGNEGILEEVEATVDAVDTKDTDPREVCAVPRA